jgi:hypothetical protein
MKSSLLLAGLTCQATRLKLLIPMRSHPALPDQSILLEANSILVFLGVKKAVPSRRDLCTVEIDKIVLVGTVGNIFGGGKITERLVV